MNLRQTRVTFGCLILLSAATAVGQDNSSQILPRGYVASVSEQSTSRFASSSESAFLNPRRTVDSESASHATSNELGLALADASLRRQQSDGEDANRNLSTELGGSIVTVASSLAVVLGLFAGLMWLTRRFGSSAMNAGTIPQDVMRPLGSTSIDARTRVMLLRCGNRILVVGQTQTGIHPLSEITDAEEVQSLTAACSGDSKRAFSSTLQSIGGEQAPAGFVATEAPTRPSPPPRKLFASA